jgi:hypothetical protein
MSDIIVDLIVILFLRIIYSSNNSQKESNLTIYRDMINLERVCQSNISLQQLCNK